jgi:hypothetical protein
MSNAATIFIALNYCIYCCLDLRYPILVKIARFQGASRHCVVEDKCIYPYLIPKINDEEICKETTYAFGNMYNLGLSCWK